MIVRLFNLLVDFGLLPDGATLRQMLWVLTSWKCGGRKRQLARKCGGISKDTLRKWSKLFSEQISKFEALGWISTEGAHSQKQMAQKEAKDKQGKADAKVN